MIKNKDLYKIYRKESNKHIDKLKRILNYPSICEICDESVPFGINAHHIDGDVSCSTRKNILFLCPGCHMIIHRGLQHHYIDYLNSDKDEEKFKELLKKYDLLTLYRERWLRQDRKFKMPKFNGLRL